MNSIEIRRPHALAHVAAIKLVQSIAEDLAEQYDAEYEWDGDSLRFKRSGIKGAIHILPKEVHLRAELGFFFIPLRSTIEAHIIKFLDDHAMSDDPEATGEALRRAAGASPFADNPSPRAATSRAAASKAVASKSVASKAVAKKAPAKKVAAKKVTQAPAKKTVTKKAVKKK